MALFKMVKQTLFDMLFVMTDGNHRPSKSAFKKLVFLYMLDLCQVVRVMLSPSYGWSHSTYSTAKHIDMVYNGVALVALHLSTALMIFEAQYTWCPTELRGRFPTAGCFLCIVWIEHNSLMNCCSQASIFIPRYSFFILAFCLVSFAIADAVYCAKLLKNNEINTIKPIKVLRFMVVALVTTLFSSVIKWLLIPLECLSNHDYRSMSALMHGEEDRCTPWEVPEIVISIPTIIVACLYITFAVMSSYFSLEPNCLSCHPNAKFTGHVDVIFLVLKIAITCFVYISKSISSVATNAVILLVATILLWKHLAILPFHSHGTNLFRGGIYGVVFWMSCSNLIVAVVRTAKLADDFWFFNIQWILLACIPISFPMGVALVHNQRSKILLSIDRLRGEWEANTMATLGNASIASRGHTGRRMSMQLMEALPQASALRSKLKKRSQYQDFFDPSWERKRAFSSASNAHTVARVLLYQREEIDLPFLSYVVSRGLEEFTTSNSTALNLFRLALLRFVFKNTEEASLEEKKLSNSNARLSMAEAYVLYCVERKASQERASSQMGKGAVFNAINLMEFDSGMQQARSAHLQCISEMKGFWRTVQKERKLSPPLSPMEMIEECVERLTEFDKAYHRAKQEYNSLLEKYPQSFQLLSSYALFCDGVLNNNEEAQERRRQAAALDGANDTDLEEFEWPALDAEMETPEAPKSVISQSETTEEHARAKAFKNFTTWSAQIFGEETKNLHIMNMRMKGLFSLLGAISLTGFCVMQFWLFGYVALGGAHRISMNGEMRVWSVSATYLLRSKLLSAARNDSAAFAKISAEIANMSTMTHEQHLATYRGTGSQKILDLYVSSEVEVASPFVTQWQTAKVNFWTFGNDWSHKMQRSSGGSMEEFADPDYGLANLTESKAGLQYMNENLFRVASPVFENLTNVHELAAEDLWVLAKQVVIVIAVLESLMTIAIAIILVHALITTMQKIQHIYLGVVLALSLNSATVNNFFHFYKSAEKDLNAIEDEAKLRDQVLSMDLDKNGNASPRDVELTNLPEDRTPNTEFFSTAVKRLPGSLNMSERTESLMALTEENLQTLQMTKGNAEKSQLTHFFKREKNFVNWPFPPQEEAEELAEEESEKEAGSPGLQEAADGKLAQKYIPGVYGGEEGGESGIQREGEHGRSGFIARRRSSVDMLQCSEHRDITSRVLPGAGVGFESDPDDAIKKQIDKIGIQREGEHGRSGFIARRRSSVDMLQCSEHGDITSRVLPGARVGFESDPDEAIKKQIDKILGMERFVLKAHEGNSSAPLRQPTRDIGAPTRQSSTPDESPLKKEKRSSLKVGGFKPFTADVSPFDQDRGFAQDSGIASGSPNWLSQLPVFRMPARTGSPRSQVTFDRSEVSATSQPSIEIPPSESPPLGGFDERLESGEGNGRDLRLVGWNPEEHTELLPCEMVSQPQKVAIRAMLRKHRPVVMRRYVYIFSLLVILALCILNAAYPARRMGQLVHLAPTINQAARRNYLVRVCAHLSRELVLNDGLSRMEQVEVGSALRYHVELLKRVDSAVRLGGDYGINVGADQWSSIHNKISYETGCPWRENPKDCKSPGRPGVASEGLHHVLQSFLDAIENTLLRFGLPHTTDQHTPTPDFRRNPRTLDELSGFESVQLDEGRVKLLSTDEDIAFILRMYDGDLFQGFCLMVTTFDDEFVSIIKDAAKNNRTLYAVYAFSLSGLVYYFLIYKATKTCELEVKRSKVFVGRLPSQILSKLECDSIIALFASRFYA